MVIRGAPAIGVAAAMGLAIGVRNSHVQGTRQLAVEFNKTCDMMAATRPTAVNLFWAIERMKRAFARGAQAGESPDELADRLEREARAIHDEDVANCRAMGAHGAMLVADGSRVLTHCNAGALATAGYGSALPAHGPTEMPVWGPIFRALDPSDVRVAIRIDNIVEYVGKLQEPTTGTNSLGAQLFRTHCAVCHGPDARGTGTATSELRNRPPDLTGYTARNGGVFPRERLYQIIDGRYVTSHGDRDMPIWGDAFAHSRAGMSDAAVKARIDAIVGYIEGIQRRGA
jgi:mono/diheme cytochrome c family protein